MIPILKWVGGKRRFTKLIIDEIDFEYGTYIEPFFGSGALFFELMPKKSIISDLNRDLTEFYEYLRDVPEELFNEINKIINKNELYYELRTAYNENKFDGLEKAAVFFYLNKQGFNGIYRVNSNGHFNVPKGSVTTPFVPNIDFFHQYSQVLKKTKIYNSDFLKILKKAKKGDLVYLDPPYYPDESSRFVGYTDPRFGEEEHNNMINACYELWKSGVNIIISNSNSRNFYKLIENKFGKINFRKVSYDTNRSINPNSTNKNKFVECLYIMKRVVM
jgi:DNA adenine methylase